MAKSIRRDASPATYKPEIWVTSLVPVLTFPVSSALQPILLSKGDGFGAPTVQNSARRASRLPLAKRIWSGMIHLPPNPLYDPG
jgi:hypothetical protein